MAASDPNRSISGSLLGFKLILNTLGLHHRNLGYAMDDLAGAHSRFRGQFHIPAERQAILRRRNSCNELLRGLFGDVPEYDFENGNRIFDPATLREDMELIVHEFMRYPEVATHPLFADRAPADVALGVLQPTRT